MNGPLQVPAFRRLAIAWAFSNFGDSALYLTLAIWVKDLSGSDAATGIVFLFLGLPAFIAPLAGHIADRFPRRRTIAIANLVAAAVVLSLTFVDSDRQLWLIYLVTFLYGSVTYLTAACGSGLIRDLVVDEHLASANGMLSSIDQGLRLVSPLVGAGLYAAFGGPALAVLTASTLIVATLIVLTIRVVESPLTSSAERGRFFTEVAAGVAHLARTAGLARLTVWLAVATTITGLANVAIFAAIDQGLGQGSEFFALVASAQGVGAIVGGLTAARVIRAVGEPRALAAGLLIMALGMSTILGTSAALMLVGGVVVGMGIPWAYVSHATVRQRLTPGALQGRVAAAANLAFNAPQTLATAVAAALIAVVDYRVLGLVMIGTVVVSALMARGARPAPSIEPVASDGAAVAIDR